MNRRRLFRGLSWLMFVPLLLATAAPSAALERSGGLGSPEELIARFRSLSEELGIEPEQVQQAIRIGLEIYRQNTLLSARLRVARLELALLLEEQNLNTSAIRSKVDEVAQLQKERLTIEIEGQIRYREILTLEQYRRFKDALYSDRKRGGGNPHGRYGRE